LLRRPEPLANAKLSGREKTPRGPGLVGASRLVAREAAPGTN